MAWNETKQNKSATTVVCHWKSTLSAIRFCYQSEQVSRNWTMVPMNRFSGKREFQCKMVRPVISALLTRRIVIDLSKALSLCLVLNKDFAKNRWYNYRISSGGKGFCKSPCPPAPRNRASKWDETVQDLNQLRSGWLLACIFHSLCSSVCPCLLRKFFVFISGWNICWCNLWLLSLVFCFGPLRRDPARPDRNFIWKS